MRKILLFSTCLLTLSLTSNAQFFVKVGGGYAWPGLIKTSNIKGFQPLLSDDVAAASKVLDPAYASIIDMADITHKGSFNGANMYQDSFASTKSIHDSYGRGGNMSLGIGYRINPYVSVELDGSFLFGAKTTSTQNLDNLSTLGKGTQIITKTYASGVTLIPAVTLYGAKAEQKVVPYVRLGLVLPVAGKTTHVIDVNSPAAFFGTQNLSSELVVETQSTVSLGFQGGLGVSYNPLKFLSIWGEVNGIYLDVRGKTSTLTKYTIDATANSNGAKTHADRIAGTGDLPAILGAFGVKNDPLSTYSKVIEYADDVTSASNTEEFGLKRDPSKSGTAGYVDESKNHIKQRLSAPFSNIGFNIGVTFWLSKKTLGMKDKKASGPVSLL